MTAPNSMANQDQRHARHLVVATATQSTGQGAFLTGSVVFFVTTLALTPATVGAGLSLAAAVGLLATVPISRLADRYDPRHLLTAIYLLLGALFATYPLVDRPLTFVITASLISVGEVSSSPLRATVVHALFPPHDAVQVRARMRRGYNIGFMAGAGIAGLTLAHPTATMFWLICGLTAGAHLATAATLRTLPPVCTLPPVRPRRSDTRPVRSRTALRSPRFLLITAGNGLLEVHATVLTLGIPLWVIFNTDAKASVAAAAIIANTLIVIALQVRVARNADTRHGATRLLTGSGVLLAAGCVLAMFSFHRGPLAATIVLIGAAVLLSLGEIAQAAGGWALPVILATPDRHGDYQGVFSLGRGLQQFIGPALITLLFTRPDPIGWLILAAGFLTVAVATAALAATATQPLQEHSMPDLITPPPVRPDAHIRIVSPGMPILAYVPERGLRAEVALQALGYTVTYSEHAFDISDDGMTAGTAADRAADLMAAFTDPDVDVILASEAGLGSKDLLPHLNPTVINAHPKPFLGYCDNVFLNQYLATHAGISSLYGATLMIHLGEGNGPYPETITHLRDALTANRLDCTPVPDRSGDLINWYVPDLERQRRRRTIPGGWNWLRPGHGRGALHGAELSILPELIDDFDLSLPGTVLFWDISYHGQSPAALFHQLHTNADLTTLAGMIIGSHPTRSPQDWALEVAAILDAELPDVTYPVVVNADLSHTTPSWIVPYGENVILDAPHTITFPRLGPSHRAAA